MTEHTPEPLFLLSLPRSGSTLLQRLLAAHEKIATAPEPWVLLAPLYALRTTGAFTEYGHQLQVQAVEDLCAHLPNGRDDYLAAVADMARSLYTKASPPGTAYFLDKTPRYNLVSDDLLRMFPHSTFIVLWRNPLAVVASCVDTWLDRRWMPSLFKIDLFAGLEQLLRTYSEHPDRFVAVRYEDLVTNGREQLARILHALNLPFRDDLLSTFSETRLDGRLGDHAGVERYASVSPASVERWKEVLASPVRKLWCRRYLRWIGAARLEMMGYSLDALLHDLESLPNHPGRMAADAYWTGRGVIRDACEPVLFREKIRRLPHWRAISGHA